LAGKNASPEHLDDGEAQKMAKELERLLLAEEWGKARQTIERLTAGDRAFAARVLTIVLENERVKARSHVIAAIERSGLKEATPILIRLLDHADEGIRYWSATTLGTLADKSVVGALEKRLKAEPRASLRRSLRLSLAQLGRPYVKYFIDGLSDRNPDLRRTCLLALGQLKDKRAVPFVLKLLESEEAWEPYRAADTITRITGIENTIVTKKTVHPDGSVSQTGIRRPVQDLKKDCEKWLALHRREVDRALDQPPEPWSYTPEPLLPGLNVSFVMNAQQVLQVYKGAKLPCQHQPEKRWNDNGTSFLSREEISASRSCLESLNEALGGIRYIFEGGRLSRIYVTLNGRGDSVIDPLKKPLKLRRQHDGTWTGLDGAIVLSPRRANGESETWEISPNFSKDD
jgi:hypothetical protein